MPTMHLDLPDLRSPKAIQRARIGRKDVFVFEDHSAAFAAWAAVAVAQGCPVQLLTFDHHTDTLIAFGRATALTTKSVYPMHKQYLDGLDPRDGNRVAKIVNLLAHDEQIDAAIRAGVLSRAYIICHMTSCGWFRNEDDIRDNFAAVAPPITQFCVPSLFDCEDEEKRAKYARMAIESVLLRKSIEQIDFFCKYIGVSRTAEPYVLDIDLDYFHSPLALLPTDHTVFHDLIRGAAAITIAVERECVEMLSIAGDPLEPGRALRAMEDHIRAAMDQDEAR